MRDQRRRNLAIERFEHAPLAKSGLHMRLDQIIDLSADPPDHAAVPLGQEQRRSAMPEVVNISINDVLSRTLMTTMTTFMSMTALCVFGGEGIKGFTYAMLVGILFGPYSSMFFSAPLLTYMNLRRGAEDADEKKPDGKKSGSGKLASQKA